MVVAAKAGDKEAEKWVRRYHFRPEFELYDLDEDPHEIDNLADDPKHVQTKTKLLRKTTTICTSPNPIGRS